MDGVERLASRSHGVNCVLAGRKEANQGPQNSRLVVDDEHAHDIPRRSSLWFLGGGIVKVAYA
jgi:hypothetical protein